MARYHINPVTGDVNPCRAKIKCRFQREEEPPVVHYPTREEAQRAYEQSQEPLRPPPTEGPATSRVKVLSLPTTQEKLHETLQGGRPLTVTIGQATSTEKSLEGLYRRYQEAADELVSAFQEVDAHRFPTRGFTYTAQEQLSGHPEFIFLGEGVDKAAFLHKSTDLVYKVLFARAGNGEHQRNYLHRYQEKEQQLIAALDDDKLASWHVRYAKNYFLESDGVPVIAQEYLAPEDYEPYDLEIMDRQLTRCLEQEGLRDMHLENCYRQRETGEIVLFDCLHLGGKIIREVTGEEHFRVEE